VHAVLGNNDGPDVSAWRASETAQLDLAGLRVGMIHDAGPTEGRLARLRRRFPGIDLVVFGHSHFPLQAVDDASFMAATNGGTLATYDARTTRKLVDPVPAYGSITLGAFTTADNGTASTNPVTIAKPACSVGDLLILQFFMRGAGNISGMTGWTQFSSNFISASGNNKQWIYYKAVDGTEPSS
jgi:hypothetical protein